MNKSYKNIIKFLIASLLGFLSNGTVAQFGGDSLICLTIKQVRQISIADERDSITIAGLNRTIDELITTNAKWKLLDVQNQAIQQAAAERIRSLETSLQLHENKDISEKKQAKRIRFVQKIKQTSIAIVAAAAFKVSTDFLQLKLFE